MSILSFTGTMIYQQHLTERQLNQDFINQVSMVAMGFKNTVDISISSIQYEGYSIYFRRGANFMAIMVASQDDGAVKMINTLFDKLLHEKILGQFIEYAHNNIICDNMEISDIIRKIMYNLDFADSLSSFKQDLSRLKRVF